MEIKANIMDDTAVARALKRVSHEIIERNDSLENVVLIGIKSRGIPLAGIIAENVKKYEGVSLDVGELDISLYRDDLAEKSETPVIEKIDVPFEVRGRDVVLVDDVLLPEGRRARNRRRVHAGTSAHDTTCRAYRPRSSRTSDTRGLRRQKPANVQAGGRKGNDTAL